MPGSMGTLALGLAALAVVLVWIGHLFVARHSSDLGRMSDKWLAEYNGTHP